MLVLGIESSCDETGIALYDYDNKKLLADIVYKAPIEDFKLDKSYLKDKPNLFRFYNIFSRNISVF